MSSDGKVIVYEEQLRHLEARRRDRKGQRDQARHRHRREGKRGRRRERSPTRWTRSTFSPSGRRAVISARGQILTIATDRGDITRVAPGQDGVAQRVAEVVARRQVHRVRLRSLGPRRGLDQRSGRHEPEEDHRSRQRKGLARLDAGLEGAALHGGGQEAVQLQRRGRQDRRRLVERSRPDRIGRRSRPTASGSRSRSRIGRCARTSTSRRSPAAKSVTSPTTACSTPRATRSGPPTAATSCSRRRGGQQRHRLAGRHQHDDGVVGDCRCAIRTAIR